MPDDHTPRDPGPATQSTEEATERTTEPAGKRASPQDGTRNSILTGHGPEAALRLQVIRQQSSLDRQGTRLAQHTDQIAALAAALRDKDAQIDALTQDNHALGQEVAGLRGSTSWQITGPLRVLTRAVRRLRGKG